MKLQGKIIFASKTEQITDSFRKRDLIIETDADTQWPQEIKIELHQDKVELIAGMKKGDEVIVDCNLRGRSHVNKEGKKMWFNTIAGWKVTKVGSATSEPSAPDPAPAPVPSDEEDDDLPF